MAHSGKQVRAVDFYKQYESCAKPLLAWFIGFGVGGLVLILSNEFLLKILLSKGSVSLIVQSFAIGIFSQIFKVMLNKYTNWFVYYLETENQTDKTLYSIVATITHWIIIDIVMDIVTVAFFLRASYVFYTAVASFTGAK